MSVEWSAEVEGHNLAELQERAQELLAVFLGDEYDDQIADVTVTGYVRKFGTADPLLYRADAFWSRR